MSFFSKKRSGGKAAGGVKGKGKSFSSKLSLLTKPHMLGNPQVDGMTPITKKVKKK